MKYTQKNYRSHLSIYCTIFLPEELQGFGEYFDTGHHDFFEVLLLSQLGQPFSSTGKPVYKRNIYYNYL